MGTRYSYSVFREENPISKETHKPGIWKVTTDIEAEDRFKGMPVPSMRLVRPTNLINSAELHFVDRPELGPHFLVDIREPNSERPELVAVTLDRNWVHGARLPKVSLNTTPKVRVFTYTPGIKLSEAGSHPASTLILQRLASLFWHAGKEAAELEAQGMREDTYPRSLKAKAIQRVAIALIHAADHAYARDVEKEK